MSDNSKQEKLALELDVTKLERTLEIKDKEMNKVYNLLKLNGRNSMYDCRYIVHVDLDQICCEKYPEPKN